MADASLALQTAIYTKLTNDATLMALITDVFDHVPEETAFPYVTIGQDTAVDSGTKSEQGQEFTSTLHAWGRPDPTTGKHGRTEVKTILDRIYTLLHETALTMVGFSHILTRFEFTETFGDPDGLTQHGVMRFRILVQD